MITLKSAREIDKMRASGAILAGVHRGLRSLIKPGLSTWDIETYARTTIEAQGAVASQIGFDGYRYATCVSVNEEVAHGTPRKGLLLKSGDVVKVDMCVALDGFQSDSCWTYVVGGLDVAPASTQQLVAVTKQALYLGIDQAQVGRRIGDIGHAIQTFVEDDHHMGDVRDLIGHGIQPTIHEDPRVPHFGEAGHGLRLREGMTITIEPMVNLGTWEIITRITPGDTWQYYASADNSLSAQFEHTIAITADGPKILTSQDPERDAAYL